MVLHAESFEDGSDEILRAEVDTDTVYVSVNLGAEKLT